MSEALRIRKAIIEAIPYTTSNYGESPEQRLVYVPPAHVKALRLESNLVVGSRGVGKSFWTAALDSPVLRSMLGASVRELEHSQVRIGFAVNENIDAYPNTEVFADLLNNGFTPYEVWRAVVLRWLAGVVGETIPTQDWRVNTEWVKANPEPLARLLQRANQAFHSSGQKGLIVFDALDRSSNDWRVMDGIVRDLLKVVLWLKSYPAIHAKVFLREDQFARTVTDFPDASKLLATKAELTWQPHDLHGLLWQLLCNAPDGHGEALRDIYTRVFAQAPIQHEGAWFLAGEARREDPKQRALFDALAGQWMGKDRRRGVPYVWSVSHLADGNGRTSPRSFLAAIRAAAEDSSEKYPDHPYALHYESIKRGVQKASEIRIAEMAEDYPWVKNLFEPLRGLTVPCESSVIEDRWRQQFPAGSGSFTHDRLPPQHAERGWLGVQEDLERLGLFETMKDGRINMPDLYRVGFGLGRRGGVKPMR
ncbi:hypothetical protein [Cupriavidus basilensis]|uniref:hypothetical protein n=1 Tax=Cupriavidus basilensis TaxID=68895 RepID=UPI0023E7A76B|nr:hypothetical protein [Cupriavidus basilensis]MDF3883648.1 hypothetical protein [Cupriavidus basilensis]